MIIKKRKTKLIVTFLLQISRVNFNSLVKKNNIKIVLNLKII
jgi:hypothetical protein